MWYSLMQKDWNIFSGYVVLDSINMAYNLGMKTVL